MASVLNGVELILRSKQQGGKHPETSEGPAPAPRFLIQLPSLTLPPPKKIIIVI